MGYMITQRDLEKIAFAGLPGSVAKKIEWNHLKAQKMFGVFRLYHRDVLFRSVLPVESIIEIESRGGFVNIKTPYENFNHLAAIRKMDELGLVRAMKGEAA